jgi:hypothetical protein
VYIWLKGVGRSPEELDRFVRESNNSKDARSRDHRKQQRYVLNNVHGMLIHGESKTPCQALEISQSGCSLQTKKTFRPGALAPVEVVLNLLGMVLHMSGVTQWMKRECQIGVHFNHECPRSEYQLAELISCLAGKRSVESVKEYVASRTPNPWFGDVLAVQIPEAEPEISDLPETPLPYDRLVHCGKGRLRPRREGEWPVVIRPPDHRFNLEGSLLDLSLGGCTVHTFNPFTGELHDPMEVSFGMQFTHILAGGLTQAIYDPQSIGIQFIAMGKHRREELERIIAELRAARKTQLEFS